MVIDPLTFDLKSHIDVGLLQKSQLLLHEHVKPEMHGSMLEIGTKVCTNRAHKISFNILFLKKIAELYILFKITWHFLWLIRSYFWVI